MFELHETQMFMYFLDRQGIGQVCLLCGSVLLPGKTNVADMQRAANEVLRINDGLRTRFIEKEGRVYQETRPYAEREFEVMHFADRESFHKWARTYATIPLKLDKVVDGSLPPSTWRRERPSAILTLNLAAHQVGMLFTRARYGALKREPSCFDMKLIVLPDACGAIVKLHHVIADGWTVLLVANQFVRCLHGELPQAYCYEDFIKREAEYVKSERYERDCRFMEDQYRLCPEPTWVWPQPHTSLRGSRETVEMDAESSRRIREYAGSHGLTPYTLFLTAMCVYIRRKLRRETFYVGSVIFNRAGVRERNTAGMFVRFPPLLIQLRDTDSFADALVQVRDRSFSGYRHQKGAVRTHDWNKLLYDVWVSYQDRTLEADTQAECTQYYCNYSIDTSILTIEDGAGQGPFTLHFDHNEKVKRSEVEELFRVVLGVLTQGIGDDGQPLSALCP